MSRTELNQWHLGQTNALPVRSPPQLSIDLGKDNCYESIALLLGNQGNYRTSREITKTPTNIHMQKKRKINKLTQHSSTAKKNSGINSSIPSNPKPFTTHPLTGTLAHLPPLASQPPHPLQMSPRRYQSIRKEILVLSILSDKLQPPSFLKPHTRGRKNHKHLLIGETNHRSINWDT